MGNKENRTTSLQVGDTVSGTIEGYAFGGEGILRLDGFVIFIPFTIRNEILSAQIVEIKKNFARAKIVEISSPSSERRIPFCPYFGKCGGCQLQHMSHEEQLYFKKSCVQDAFRKKTGYPPLTIDAMPPYRGWRESISLHLSSDNGGPRLSFRGENPKSLLPVSYCPIFIEAPSSLFQTLEKWISILPEKVRENGRLTLIKSHDRAHSFHIRCELSSISSHVTELINRAKEHSFSSCIIYSKKNNRRYGWEGTEEIRSLMGLDLRYAPDSFQQNHFALSQKMYQDVVTWICQKKPIKIADLYSGSGILSILLFKKGFEVASCEANPHAVSAAKENFHRNCKEISAKPIHFLLGTVEAQKKDLGRLGPFGAAILNPPRQGLSSTVKRWLAEQKPSTLIYISCMPPTLTRDLLFFTEKGYQIEKMQLYDLFPQTTHVEMAVLLTRKT